MYVHATVYIITVCLLVVICLQTKQWVGDLKMNGTVRDVGFTPDGRHLLSTGSEFLVTWDTML